MLADFFSDYNFASFFKHLKKWVVWIVLGALVICAAAFAYSHTILVDTYTSYASMYISRYNDGSSAEDIESGSGASREANTSRYLATTCMVVLKENAVADEAYKFLDNKDRYKNTSLRGVVTIEQVEESPIIRISCTNIDPQFAYDACKAYLKVTPKYLKEVLSGGSCKIVTEPQVPTIPNEPDYLKWAIAGAVAGAVLVLAVAILTFVFDRSIKSAEEIESRFGVSVWAEIPSLGKSKKRRRGQADVVDTRKKLLSNTSPFIVIESYKNARTNMAFVLAESNDKKDSKSRGCAVIFTSAGQNEGKSLTTANMALTTAKKNAKVLLVDADMRKPIQHRVFDIDNDKGLSLVLAGTCSPTECIFKLQDNLHIMPAGRIPPNPSELLDTEKMSKLIKAMCSVYDYVFIDTPPVGMVTDASVLAPKTDGAIIVVRESKTRSKALEKVIESLKIADAKILGAVMTDMKEFSKMYNYKKNRYKYRYKYSYGSYEYKSEDE